MVTIVKHHAPPPSLIRIDPTSTRISGLGNLSFYWKGCSNVLPMKRGLGDLFNVYVIPHSRLNSTDLTSQIHTLLPDINAEMTRANISTDTWFLFDMATKKVITKNSFMEHLPMWNIGKVMFIENEFPGIVYTLADDSPYVKLQAASILMAKTNLIRPGNIDREWTALGKIAVNFFVSKLYDCPGDFTSISGSWSHVNYKFTDTTTPPGVNLSRLKTDRVTQLALGMDLWNDEFYNRAPQTLEDQGDEVTLLELITTGVSPIASKFADESLNIVIDVHQDVFKKVTLDCFTGVVYISISSNCRLHSSDFEAMFGTDKIMALDETSSCVMITNDVEKGDN